jgi:ABC-type transporter Mla subunit MlaD
MPVEKSYARLGFFLFVALLVVLATAVFFIQRLKSRPAFPMVTYTTENVFGLDVSSAVRLRGVPVGQVTDIRVDPHGTLVEVDFEVFLDRLSNIGLDVKRLKTITDVGGVFPNLRAQLMGNPMTGEAYLLLNQPQNPPPPMQLSFRPNRPYVPSMSSPFTMVSDRLPELLDRANTTLDTLTEIVAKMPDSLDRSDRFFNNADRIMRDSQLPELSADSRKFFATTNAEMERIRSDMDGVMGTQGELIKLSEEARAAIKAADFPATAHATREAEESSRLAAEDLRLSLSSMRDSAEQFRELTHQIQEEPESFVYGRRPPARNHK